MTTLIALFALWFVPPLIVSSAVQVWVFRKAGARSRARGVGAILATLILTPSIGYLSMQVHLPTWLGVAHDIWLLPSAWLIAFLIGLMTTVPSLLVPRR